MSSPFNKGVRAFGLDTVLKNIEAFVHISYPARQEDKGDNSAPTIFCEGRKALISIGSGNAHLENSFKTSLVSRSFA